MKKIMLLMAGLSFAVTPSLPGQTATAEPTAAATAFTSADPVVRQARQLMDTGQFKSAEDLLAAPERNADAAARQARVEMTEILRRVRREYSLDAAGLLAKIRKSVPDATAEEMERWAQQSQVRFRIIDGQKFYFRREPQNIFLFCDEAKKRRAQAGNAPGPKWPLVKHLAAVVAEAERTGAAEVLPIKHRFTHTLTIHAPHPALKPGAQVRVWLPYPQKYRQQRDVKLISASPEPRLIAPNAVEGHPVGGGAQRTIYFEQTVRDPAQPLAFTVVVEYTSYAYHPHLDPQQVAPLPADWQGAYLGERPPHLVFPPALREQVATLVGRETNALIKAQIIFRWVSEHIPWNAEDEYGIIPSFTLKGFTARRGDCGVISSVFISMCRIAGIPARWQSGFATRPGENPGMHDWVEFYLPPWGWLPADTSYGVQASADPRIADFYCGHQDSYRLIVNRDWGRELFPPKPSLRSEPADFQRGEVEVDGQNLYFDAWTTRTEVVREPL